MVEVFGDDYGWFFVNVVLCLVLWFGSVFVDVLFGC